MLFDLLNRRGRAALLPTRFSNVIGQNQRRTKLRLKRARLPAPFLLLRGPKVRQTVGTFLGFPVSKSYPAGDDKLGIEEGN
jgi:hypothetical protein